jgi:hypothetical protein
VEEKRGSVWIETLRDGGREGGLFCAVLSSLVGRFETWL